MIASRRTILQDIQIGECTNMGLWLQKYLDRSVDSDDEKANCKLVEEVSSISEPAIYARFYESWKETLVNSGALPKKAKVDTRLAINLGSESVLETDIALLHPFGMPYIPGSALKGLAAFYARNELDPQTWEKGTEAYRILFGDGDQPGYVTFFDALYIPGTGYKGKVLWADIITPHHSEYYQGKEDAAPADWDDPTPIPFLTATGEYLIALAGPQDWVKAAFKILEHALLEKGIGAKTSSGYGRMRLEKEKDKEKIQSGEEQIKDIYALTKKRLLKGIPPDGRTRGCLIKIKDGGNYGFISPAEGGGEIFVHRNNLKESQLKLAVGQVVEYRVGRGRNGRSQAVDVDILLMPD